MITDDMMTVARDPKSLTVGALPATPLGKAASHTGAHKGTSFGSVLEAELGETDGKLAKSDGDGDADASAQGGDEASATDPPSDPATLALALSMNVPAAAPQVSQPALQLTVARASLDLAVRVDAAPNADSSLGGPTAVESPRGLSITLPATALSETTEGLSATSPQGVRPLAREGAAASVPASSSSAPVSPSSPSTVLTTLARGEQIAQNDVRSGEAVISQRVPASLSSGAAAPAPREDATRTLDSRGRRDDKKDGPDAALVAPRGPSVAPSVSPRSIREVDAPLRSDASRDAVRADKEHEAVDRAAVPVSEPKLPDLDHAARSTSEATASSERHGAPVGVSPSAPQTPPGAPGAVAPEGQTLVPATAPVAVVANAGDNIVRAPGGGGRAGVGRSPRASSPPDHATRAPAPAAEAFADAGSSGPSALLAGAVPSRMSPPLVGGGAPHISQSEADVSGDQGAGLRRDVTESSAMDGEVSGFGATTSFNVGGPLGTDNVLTSNVSPTTVNAKSVKTLGVETTENTSGVRERTRAAASVLADRRVLSKGIDAQIDLGEAGRIIVRAEHPDHRIDIRVDAEVPHTARALAEHARDMTMEFRSDARLTISGPDTFVSHDTAQGRASGGDATFARDKGGESRQDQNRPAREDESDAVAAVTKPTARRARFVL